MGFDVTFHAIKEDEIQKCYFDVLDNKEDVLKLGEEYQIDEFYVGKYKEIMDYIRENVKEGNFKHFDTTHGLNIAIIQGFLRKYFYTREGVLSGFIEDDKISLENYSKPWKEIIPDSYKNMEIEDKLWENYSSGVFIPYENLIKFKEQVLQNEELRKYMAENIFENGTIDVFEKAVSYAIENECGLLEATEVIIPHPFQQDETECYSNLYNCDEDGIFLYKKFVEEQMKKLNAEIKNVEPEEMENAFENIVTRKKEKQGNSILKKFFKKIFKDKDPVKEAAKNQKEPKAPKKPKPPKAPKPPKEPKAPKTPKVPKASKPSKVSKTSKSTK